MQGSDVANGTHPYPTGITTPAVCRFQTLTHGIDRVGSPGSVIAISANPPVAFTGETFPLVVKAGVALTTADATPTPANYTIEFDDAAAATAVSLAAGSSITGFSVAQAGTAAGSAVSCTSGAVSLSSLFLTGGDSAVIGADIGGTCAASHHRGHGRALRLRGARRLQLRQLGGHRRHLPRLACVACA